MEKKLMETGLIDGLLKGYLLVKLGSQIHCMTSSIGYV